MAIAKAHRAVCEAKGLKKVAEFRGSLSDKEDASWPADLAPLRKEVVAFARSFPVVGFNVRARPPPPFFARVGSTLNPPHTPLPLPSAGVQVLAGYRG